jgi:hypothetical protein
MSKELVEVFAGRLLTTVILCLKKVHPQLAIIEVSIYGIKGMVGMVESKSQQLVPQSYS